MIHIDNTLISEDIFRVKFACSLPHCLGGCCNSEGESGAPVADDECAALEAVVPVVWDALTPQGQRVLEQQGPVFRDSEGDLVTSVVDRHDCVFCTYSPDGLCLCAIEKAFREGRLSTMSVYKNGTAPFPKPISCHLYPIRLKKIGDFTVLNYDRQTALCCKAEKIGQKTRTPLYQNVKEALIRRFGIEWYTQLETVAREMEIQGVI